MCIYEQTSGSEVTPCLMFPGAVGKDSGVPARSPVLALSVPWSTGMLTCDMSPHCALTCVFLMTDDVEHLCTCLLAT